MSRRAVVERNTRETRIRVELELDGTGQHEIKTPLPFLSHMLDQLGRHGMFDLTVQAEGDVEIDGHHTTEDVGIVIGQAFAKALGDKAGIRRYGSATLPMDEACVTCALDLSGRTYFVWRVPMPKAKVGDFDTELTEVFFEGFARGAGVNLHMHMLEGQVLHHIIEICFKAFARALREAVSVDPRSSGVPSTKGSLNG
ncbi:MAG TPA: imidazoleglycerol-phosphate dehydratase HisB [Polyangiales bacterium]|jgi:imidazoleglycerol-phosphate dehydratase|nr:imidazoleglycerol-phosphate dehydratase HisB [Polyangiales bacterium]